MRPRSLLEFIGQTHLIGEGSPLRALIAGDAVGSIILWGPPGTGKTTLANVIANSTRSRYVELSATSASVAEVRKTIAEAKQILGSTGTKTILFIDEIHRFNKSQQDALLPAVENRWVTLVGATTENPFFEVNSPLLSRCLLFRLERLSPGEIETIIQNALIDEKKGLGASNVKVQPDAMAHILATSGGDARSALNALEVCVASATLKGLDAVDLAIAEEALQKRQVRYDKKADTHYDVVSAFIKSMRGSDPDAALFWLARMLEAGEDPKFIVRRMIIFASEDVGNADPTALLMAVATSHALQYVGLPEAALNMAQAVTYLATAPKSNASTVALGRATRAVEGSGGAEVPAHLRDSHYPGAGKLGHGKGYEYPHDHPGAWVDQSYMPSLTPTGAPVDTGNIAERFYEPTDRGYEATIKAAIEKIEQLRRDR
ncbi:MAG: replication-associated recombination protein A [Actinomycetota bacterium]|nr:replication-associated recombination protein A [Actinomycetota bacterium]